MGDTVKRLGAWGLASGVKGWTGRWKKRSSTRSDGGRSPPRVQFDLYGHSPTELRSYKTRIGCCFSVLLFIFVAASCSFVIYDFLTVPFDIAQASVPNNPDFKAQPESSPSLPDFGVAFRLANGSTFPVDAVAGVLEILFWQSEVVGSGQKFEEQKLLRLGTERCRFIGENPETDPPVEAYCPSFGNFVTEMNESTRTETTYFNASVPPGQSPDSTGRGGSVREGALYPYLQGKLREQTFASVRAVVQVDLRGVDMYGAALGVDLQDIYRGTIMYVVAGLAYTVDNVRIVTKSPFDSRENQNLKSSSLGEWHLRQEYKLFQRAFDVKEYLSAKVDVNFAVRDIVKSNFILDFGILEQEYQDIVVDSVEQELDDGEFLPDINALLKQNDLLPNDTVDGVPVEPVQVLRLGQIFFKMADDYVQIVIYPSSTLFDILGLLGGLLSLSTFLIGWPALLINQWQFKSAFSEAMQQCRIPKKMVSRDGRIRMGWTNEILNILDEMRLESHSEQRKKAQGGLRSNLAYIRQWPFKGDFRQRWKSFTRFVDRPERDENGSLPGSGDVEEDVCEAEALDALPDCNSKGWEASRVASRHYGRIVLGREKSFTAASVVSRGGSETAQSVASRGWQPTTEQSPAPRSSVELTTRTALECLSEDGAPFGAQPQGYYSNETSAISRSWTCARRSSVADGAHLMPTTVENRGMSFCQGVGAGLTPGYRNRSANSFSFTCLGWTRQHHGYVSLNLESTGASDASPETCLDMQATQNAAAGKTWRRPLEWLRIGKFTGPKERGERDLVRQKPQSAATAQESPRTHFSLAVYPSVSLDGDESGPSER